MAVLSNEWDLRHGVEGDDEAVGEEDEADNLQPDGPLRLGVDVLFVISFLEGVLLAVNSVCVIDK